VSGPALFGLVLPGVASARASVHPWRVGHAWRTGMAVLMRIERWDPRRDGPLSQAALRQKLEARGYVVSTCTWPPGAIVAAQAQDRDRVDAVVSGLLKVTLDGESAILTAGDMVVVPRGSIRRVEVVGPSAVSCLDAVYQRDGV
jgi:quercetin dioxygenase-like cupin family protein